MAEAVLQVAQAGPLCSLQDGGRPAYMRFGVPASGPMDRAAFALANAALGNPPGAAGVEVSAGGMVLELVQGDLTVAVAGGGFILQHGAERFGSWSVLTLKEGDRLAIRPGPWGSWTYLAVAGWIAAPTWLGAAATHSLSGLGGGTLVKGARLMVQGARAEDAAPRPIPCPVWARPGEEVLVTLGPQERFFAPDTIETLLEQPFALSRAYDRMGLRLDGPKLPPEGALAIPSEPLLRGSVQVSGDGVASVLMADHQTTGGYPKIAVLAGPETDRLAQLRPGQPFRFRAASPEAALHLARQRARALDACLARLAPA